MRASSRALASAGKVALAPARARRALPAAVEVTEEAASRLRALLAGKPAALGVRLGVKTRACGAGSGGGRGGGFRRPPAAFCARESAHARTSRGLLAAVAGPHGSPSSHPHPARHPHPSPFPQAAATAFPTR